MRAFAEADIPQVADLFWRYMRRRPGSAPLMLQSIFRELYFSSPFQAPAFPSLVFEGHDGQVVGFLGGIVRLMSFRGQPLRVTYGSNLVVHPEFRSGRAAPELVGTFLNLDYDLTMTDSANNLSRRILEGNGLRIIPVLNIHWRRPLQPSRYAVYGLSRSARPWVAVGIRFATKPFCAAADSVATRLSVSPYRQRRSHLQGAELDVETLLQCLLEFRKDYSLWAEYDRHSLGWLLSFMERARARGDLRKVVLRDDKQQVVGWYIYYVKREGVGEVVQFGGQPKSTKDILDHLFYDAWERGVVALHGVVDSRRMADYSDKGCFFTCRGGWTMAKSRKPELLDRLERGDVFFSRLDGEWCLDPGH